MLKSTNIWLKSWLHVTNCGHKEYLWVCWHISMAYSWNWNTFLTFFLKEMSLFKNLFFLETHRVAWYRVLDISSDIQVHIPYILEALQCIPFEL